MTKPADCQDHYHCRAWHKLVISIDALLGRVVAERVGVAMGTCLVHRMPCESPGEITCLDACPTCGGRHVESVDEVDARKRWRCTEPGCGRPATDPNYGRCDQHGGT